jgi:2-polyprenyl-3-methyl-5-hydroxy-6-metoxy-1,4-benzoquinol methylase
MEKATSFYDRTYFDGIGKSNYVSYTRKIAPFGEYAKDIQRLLLHIDKPEGSVLDIGCAKGYLVEELVSRGVTASGIDCSAYAVSVAPVAIRGSLQVGDARELPFGDGSFDMAVSFDVLEHFDIPSALRALREAARVSSVQLHQVNTGWTPAVAFDGDESHVLRLSLEQWYALAAEAGCDKAYFIETGGSNLVLP